MADSTIWEGGRTRVDLKWQQHLFHQLWASSLNHCSFPSTSEIEIIVVTEKCLSICLDLDLDLVADVHVAVPVPVDHKQPSLSGEQVHGWQAWCFCKWLLCLCISSHCSWNFSCTVCLFVALHCFFCMSFVRCVNYPGMGCRYSERLLWHYGVAQNGNWEKVGCWTHVPWCMITSRQS